MTSTIEGNNSVGFTLEATVEEGDPGRGLKNVMVGCGTTVEEYDELQTQKTQVQKSHEPLQQNLFSSLRIVTQFLSAVKK
jgi:hypothetical protein